MFRERKMEITTKRDTIIEEERTIQERLKELKQEKEELDKKSKEFYLEYVNYDRGKDFILLNDVPDVKFLGSTINPLREYSYINIHELSSLLKKYYQERGILFDTSFSNKEGLDRTYEDYHEHTYTRIVPQLTGTLNNKSIFTLPYMSNIFCDVPKEDLIEGKGENGIEMYTPHIPLVNSKYDNWNYMYDHDCYVPIDYGSDSFIRDLIVSIAYFQKQNKTRSINNEIFREEISSKVLSLKK